VRPPWEPAGTTPIDVIIDPGQAFGTGAHASTRLCLELMLDLARGRGSPAGARDAGARGAGERARGGRAAGARAAGALLDLGCGSGVLGIVGARLGWAPVLAVDDDPASVDAARANARTNAVALDVRRLDLRSDQLPEAPTVVANLLSPLLIAGASRIAAGPVREVIASGILVPEADEVARAFAAHGLTVADRRARGEWAALLLAPPP
jgi:ribosomal protein L11 methyltransferase